MYTSVNFYTWNHHPHQDTGLLAPHVALLCPTVVSNPATLLNSVTTDSSFLSRIHINQITQWVFQCGWLCSVKITIVKFMLLVLTWACSFFIAVQYSIIWIYHKLLLINTSIVSNLGSYEYSWYEYLCACLLVDKNTNFCSVCILWSRVAGKWSICLFSLNRYFKNVFLEQLSQFTPPLALFNWIVCHLLTGL